MDAELRYQVTKSIVNKGTLTVSEDIGIPGKDGRYYSFYGLGQSILAIPLYLLSKPITGILRTDPKYASEFMFSFLNILLVSLICVLLFKFLLLLGYSYKVSLSSTLALGLSTPLWFYAKYPTDLVPIAFFILLSFFLAYKGRFFLSALSLGFAIITREHAILALPSLFVLLTIFPKERRMRYTMNIILGLLPFAMIAFGYNYYRYGNIFLSSASGFPYGGGAVWGNGGSPWGNFIPYGIYGLFLSPGKGLLFYAPVVLLALISISKFLKTHKRLGIASLLVIVFYVIMFSFHRGWSGGRYSFGPRFLIPILPFFFFFLADYLSKQKRTLFYPLFVLGLIIQIGGISVNPQRYAYKLAKAGEEVDIINSIRYSPIIRQFENLREVVENYSRRNQFTIKGPFSDFIACLQYQATVNLPWFWWIYIYYIGIPGSVSLIIVLLLLSLVCFLFMKLMLSVERRT